MPITPPSFQVQQISPSALLDREDDSAFDRAIELGQQYFYQQQLQKASQQAALDRQRESIGGQHQSAIQQIFARAVAAGELQRVEDATLPGEVAPEDLTIVRSPGGQEYYSTQDIGRAEVRARREQPLESYGGRDFLPGTTRGDVFTDPGQEISQSNTQQFVQGNFTEFEAALRHLVPRGSDPTAEALVDDLIQRAATDPSFSLAEQRELEETARRSLETTDVLVDTIRQQRVFDRETRMLVGNELRNNTINYEVFSEGNRRRLTHQEAQVLAMRDVVGTEGMTDAQRALLDRFDSGEVQLVPSIGTIDRREAVLSNYTASGNQESDGFNAMVDFMEGLVLSETGEIINQEVAEDIRNVVGDVNKSSIQDFVARQYHSAPYRRAWAVFAEYGFTTADEIRDFFSRPNSLPEGFTTQNTISAFEKLFPEFYAGGAGRAGLYIDQPVEATTAEQNESRYAGVRDSFVQSIEGASPTLVDALSGVLDANADAPDSAAAELRYLASQLTGRTDAQQWLEQWASYISNLSPTQTREFSDSIVGPAVNTYRNNTRN